MSGSNLLFLLSGSIACYKACEAISQLVQRGHRVRTVATEAALRFVGTATLEGLTREKVATDLFAEGGALDHIELGRWADAVVLCPATAHTLNRVAAGLGDDLVGALLLAHDWKKPLVIAPAMNPAMWRHPATVASVERLQGWGARFVAVGEGRTACGEVGAGRLAEPAEIVAAVEAARVRPVRRLRVLITSGGTVEPIDGVRVIANLSTGATGALIAEHFARSGHAVVLLRAEQARRANGMLRQDTFTTFADLDAALERWLANEEFDAVIHAAAVSDFAVHSVEVDGAVVPSGATKLASDRAPVLRLQRNPKLLDTLRARSRNRAVRIVAFKLTNAATADEVRAAVQPLLGAGRADLVVHNDWSARVAGAAFPADIWSREESRVEHCAGRPELAATLERLLVLDAGGGAASAPSGAPTGRGSATN